MVESIDSMVPPAPPKQKSSMSFRLWGQFVWPGSIVFRQQRSKGYFFLSSPSVYTRGFGVFDHPNIKSSHTFLVILYSDCQRPFHNRFCRPKRATKCAMYTFTSMRMIWCVVDTHPKKKKKRKKRGLSTLVPDTYYNKPCL